MVTALDAAGKGVRRALGIKAAAASTPRNDLWYGLSPARRIIAATLGISVSADSPTTDRTKTTDVKTDVGYATIESLGLNDPPVEVSESGAVSFVRSRLDILYEILTAAASPSSGGPFMGGIYLNTARRHIWQLREGLTEQRLQKNEALRLVGLIEHNLREAEKLHRRQSGLPLDEDTLSHIGDLVELGNEITGQGTELRQLIIQLFDDAQDSTRLIPSQ